MNLDYAKIKEAAQNYQKDMTKFLREIVKNPGESCDEKGFTSPAVAEETEKVRPSPKLRSTQWATYLGYNGNRKKP